MTRPSLLLALVSGVLVANGVPHIGSGVTGRHHLTPDAEDAARSHE